MKRQKLSWSELEKEIKEAKEDPKFMKALKAFIDFHSGKTS